MTPQVTLPLSENDSPKTIRILEMTPQQNGRSSLTGNKRPAPYKRLIADNNKADKQ